MKHIWMASDCTRGAMYDIDAENLSPISIAYRYGRAESGEIIHIWNDDNTERDPDHRVMWDAKRREYRAY